MFHFCSRPFAPNQRAIPAVTGSGRTVPAILSRWSITALNMETCSSFVKPITLWRTPWACPTTVSLLSMHKLCIKPLMHLVKIIIVYSLSSSDYKISKSFFNFEKSVKNIRLGDQLLLLTSSIFYINASHFDRSYMMIYTRCISMWFHAQLSQKILNGL